MHTAHTLAKWIGKYAVLLHWSDPKMPIKLSYEELQELLDYIQYMEDCLCDSAKDSPWISVTERLPEVIEMDGRCNSVFVVWKVAPECGSQYSESSTVYLNKYPEKFTHWMPIPEYE